MWLFVMPLMTALNVNFNLMKPVPLNRKKTLFLDLRKHSNFMLKQYLENKITQIKQTKTASLTQRPLLSSYVGRLKKKKKKQPFFPFWFCKNCLVFRIRSIYIFSPRRNLIFTTFTRFCLIHMYTFNIV